MKKSVCIDLDGVLAEYDGWKGVDHIGDPIPGARAFLRNLQEDFEVVIHTVRVSEHSLDDDHPTIASLVALVEAWLDKHALPYDRVWSGVGKPIGVHYVDDRAIQCAPLEVTPAVAFNAAYQDILVRMIAEDK